MNQDFFELQMARAVKLIGALIVNIKLGALHNHKTVIVSFFKAIRVSNIFLLHAVDRRVMWGEQCSYEMA